MTRTSAQRAQTPAQGRPEESVERVQCRPRPLPLEHGDLLSQGKDLQGGVASTAQEDADHGDDGESEFRHELTLVTRRDVVRAGGSKLQSADFKRSRGFD